MSAHERDQLQEAVRLFVLREYASRKRLEDPRLKGRERELVQQLHSWASRVLGRLQARLAWAEGRHGQLAL